MDRDTIDHMWSDAGLLDWPDDFYDEVERLVTEEGWDDPDTAAFRTQSMYVPREGLQPIIRIEK